MPGRPILAIANRAEIAIRIARTADRLGWQPVALLGDPDLESLSARTIGMVEPLGLAGSELDVTRVVAAALRAGATALHPGYGFLSERPELSRACADAGIRFIGPSPETLELCGDKIATRAAAVRAGVPVLAASEPLTLDDPDRWAVEAEQIGFPLIAKVAGGGGGRGLRVALDSADLSSAIQSALREAGASGAGVHLYLERYLTGARHVEVQVAGDGSDAVALGDRDCSIQRRHQKVVEEAPAFGLSAGLRDELHHHAIAVAREVRLCGLGTVEFLLSHAGELAFIEINPRLQVEHTVTEEVTGMDLVEIQLTLANGGELPAPVEPRGHAFQARLYAEDPFNHFVPTPGDIPLLEWPNFAGLRVDAGYGSGDAVPSHYDAMLGKMIVHGQDRAAALALLRCALKALRVAGIATNRPWLLALLDNDEYAAACHTLALADEIQLTLEPPPVEAIAAVVQFENASIVTAFASAWESAGPFRIVEVAARAFHGDEAGGWQLAVSIDRDNQVLNAGVAVTAPLGSAVVARDDGWDVTLPRGRWLVQPGARLAQAAAEDSTDGALRAPMPGTVVAVNVKPGQAVTSGEVLVVMTAMKIEIALSAPFDGVVARVDSRAGDLVSTRQTLVTVAPAGDVADAGE
jgi:3-methylcrotonyl-CoA carboxylase alpha subunit